MNLSEAAEVESIRHTMAVYCHRIDDGDLDGWAELFTPDATLSIGRNEYCGRGAIREWAEGSLAAAPEATRHMVANVEIELERTTATAVSDFMVLSASMSVLVAGRYDDRLQRDRNGWAFAERRITFFRPEKR